MEIAKLNGYKPWQQEKHYIQSLILDVISDYPLVFKGGTYLWFFQGLQRFSEDVDFTASGNISSDLPERVSRGLDLLAVENTVKVMSDNERGLTFRVMANGPLFTNENDRCVVYVEISKREPVVLGRVPLRFEHPEYQLPIKHLLGMALDEVAAEKVRAVLMRDKARDVYDLYYLIAKKHVAFDAGLVNGKLQLYGSSFSKSSFLKEVKDKQSAFSKELAGMMLDTLPSFSEIFSAVSRWVA